MRHYAPSATPWQLYRARIRTMCTALLAALTALLTLGSALALWHTPTPYTGLTGAGITHAHAMHLISVADTWQAQAALAELPAPPPHTGDSPHELPTLPPEAQHLPQPSPPDLPPPPRHHTIALPESAEPAYFSDLIPLPPPSRPTRKATAASPSASPTPAPPASTRFHPKQAAAPTARTATAQALPSPTRQSRHGTIHPARYRSAPPPPYPPSLRAQRISGTVGVLIDINAEGTPTGVTVTTPSGHHEFDDAARRWILQRWKFHPATRSGIPINSQVRTQIRFVLH